jgi:hypothetical protein
MLNKLHLAMTLAALGMAAACTSDSDPAAPGGDAGPQSSGGSSNTGGDGDASSAGNASSNGGDGNDVGDSDSGAQPSGDGDAGDESSDGGDGGGVSVTPGGAEGIYLTIDGDDRAFPGATANVVSASELTLSGGAGDPGETFSLELATGSSDPLEPGTYDCASGGASFQYNPPGAIRLHFADNQSGDCTVELISVGAAAGDHITGTFTATFEQASGAIGDAGPDMLMVTNGSFDVVR